MEACSKRPLQQTRIDSRMEFRLGTKTVPSKLMSGIHYASAIVKYHEAVGHTTKYTQKHHAKLVELFHSHFPVTPSLMPRDVKGDAKADNHQMQDCYAMQHCPP